MKAVISAASIGIGAIGLGCKGFTTKGLPWSKRRNITGNLAKVLGTVSIIIGAAFISFAILVLSKGW